MQRAVNSVGVVFFPAFDWAISPTHPERQERLLYTMDQLKEEGVFDIQGITEYKPDLAKLNDLSKVHFCFPDTISNITNSHLVSAGGCLKAAELRMEAQKSKSFALVRPPGHHAMKVVHGGRGFCNINIEAIMIEYIRDKYGVQKIAIVDTDCHHGDGTQDIYWHDPDTLYISLHQDGRTLFPGTGFPKENGGPKALGKTVNVPLPPGTSDEGILSVLDDVVLPILDDFQPGLIINSAGQDNHFSDPITNMNFSAYGYAELTRKLNPDIAVLEGGYSIQGALPYVNLSIILAMAGLDYSYVYEPDFNIRTVKQDKKTTEYIKKICETARNIYFHPGRTEGSQIKEENFFVRSKDIFYDTSYITERQKEMILDCEHCKGVLKIESSSSRQEDCLGIEIPKGACERCQNLGNQWFEKAKSEKHFKNIQLIDRILGTSFRHIRN